MFTDDEVAALCAYSGPRYREINDHLRGEEDYGPSILALDRAVGKTRLATDLVLYRGINGDAAARLRASEIGVGDRFSDAGFVSVSADPAASRLFAAWPAGGLVLRIAVDIGMQALDMMPFSQHPDEREFLLPRDLLVEVTGFPEDDAHMIDVKVCQ